MRQNAYFLAKIGADTAENEQHFAELAKNWQLPYGSAVLLQQGGLRGQLGHLARAGLQRRSVLLEQDYRNAPAWVIAGSDFKRT